MAQYDGNDLNAPFSGNFKIDKCKDNYEHAKIHRLLKMPFIQMDGNVSTSPDKVGL